MNAQITYLSGDATNLNHLSGNKILVHCCNDLGKWGKGFVLAISKRWKLPEEEYLKWAKEKKIFQLGQVQLVQVEPTLWIANLIGQHGIKSKVNPQPICYSAIEEGLKTIATFAQRNLATIHMPRIGCGLAGGSWDQIEPILQKTLKDLKVFVYNFN